MFRTAVTITTTLVAAVMAGGISVAAASAGLTHASRHGTERIVLVDDSTNSGRSSVIATGFFTDGGTVNIFAAKPVIRLGGGQLRLRTVTKRANNHLDKVTRLLTVVGHGAYRISNGTGKYRAISGAGSFTTVGHAVFRRKASGACMSTHPLAFQAIVTLSGSVTER